LQNKYYLILNRASRISYWNWLCK